MYRTIILSNDDLEFYSLFSLEVEVFQFEESFHLFVESSNIQS
jgi:hypothetical protein